MGLVFGNFELGKVQGMKFNDVDGDGNPHETGEEFMNEWTIRLYTNWGDPVEIVTSNTGTQGQYRFTGLLPGTYQVCEVLKEGWAQTWPHIGDYPVGDNSIIHPEFGVAVANPLSTTDEGRVCWQTVIDESGEFNYLLRFGNANLSDVHGYKWNDLNGDGDDENGEEPKLGGWRIFIDDNGNGTYDEGERNTLTDSVIDPGWYWFTGLLPGTYSICEELQVGWGQTYPNPACHSITLPYVPELTRLFVVNVIDEAPAYNFGNQALNPEVAISKSNNKSGGSWAGDTITYTLIVTNNGNLDLNSLVVKDYLAGGFNYLAGSTKIDSVSAADPTISGGQLSWNIGDLVKGGSKTIEYQATVASDQIAGIYKNYATCTAIVGFGEVFTRIFIRELKTPECNIADSSVNIGQSTSYGGNLTPQVLGAATELPATGSSTLTLILAVLAGIFGIGLKIYGRRSNPTAPKATRGDKYVKN
jgi:uncharacterized repeat protein (TIGR01451 family)